MISNYPVNGRLTDSFKEVRLEDIKAPLFLASAFFTRLALQLFLISVFKSYSFPL